MIGVEWTPLFVGGVAFASFWWGYWFGRMNTKEKTETKPQPFSRQAQFERDEKLIKDLIEAFRERGFYKDKD